MKTKLWEKETKTDKLIESFTIGTDNIYDLYLAKYDVIASRAHATMLASVGLITEEELSQLLEGLKNIELKIDNKQFKIDDGVEDMHSQIELELTAAYGDVGKKIHTGRSRNDQVLTAIKLFLKEELTQIKSLSEKLIEQFVQLSNKHKSQLLPGYTHFQVAMPSSFDMWFHAYAESLQDDLHLLDAAYQIADKNPLGSAAGFGSSFPLDRKLTTELMGFSAMNVSSIYAQMTRGKTEKAAAIALAGIASTLSKFSYDICLYLSQNFDFISFPDNLTTGSSIMPHKKNPDVLELIRAKCNLIQGLPNQFTLLTNNLPSGYHRDMQLTKQLIIDGINEMKSCLEVMLHVLPQIRIKENLLADKKYQYAFSVEAVNKLVIEGHSFRDAYHIVSKAIANGDFKPDLKLAHTHQGSIGNC